LGGDYTEGVKGVGIVNGLEAVRDFDVNDDLKGGLEKFRAWMDCMDPELNARAWKEKSIKERRFHKEHKNLRTKWVAPENFPSDAVIMAYTNPVVDTSTQRFSFGVPDLEALVSFVTKHTGWAPEETRKMVKPVVERVEGRKSYQPRIDSYMSYARGIKFADVRSKRLRGVFASVQNRSSESEEDSNLLPPRVAVAKKRKTRSNLHIPASLSVAGISQQDASLGTNTEINHGYTATDDVGADGFYARKSSVLDITQTTKGESVTATMAQPKKKPKPLSSYLSQSKATDKDSTTWENAEAIRERKRKSIPARAPPAYAETSKLSTTVADLPSPSYSETSKLASDKDSSSTWGHLERPNFPSVALDSDPAERPNFPSIPFE
jgi:hypothetical protein